MKLAFLINPQAGIIEDPSRLQQELSGRLEKSDILGVFHVSTDKENLLEAARQMIRSGCERLVIAGGDGTIHQILPALVGSRVPLGILALGSVNLLALEMGIPKDIPQALDIIRRGKTTTIDAGKANQRFFFQVVGYGLDAHILSYVTMRWHKKWRFLYLPVAGMRAWAKNKIRRWHIRCDGKVFQREGQGIIIANGAMYGGPFRLAPNVANNDGILDLFIVPKIPLSTLARFCVGIFTSLPIYADMEHLRGSRFVLECEDAMKGIPAHADGEVGLELPLDVEVKPKAISLLIP